MSYITSLWRKTAIPENKIYNYILRERDERRLSFTPEPAAGGFFLEIELSRRHFPCINLHVSIFREHSVRIYARKIYRKRSIAKFDFWKFPACGGLWGSDRVRVTICDYTSQKFNTLKQEWKTVLPTCSGKCSNAPNLGWITTGKTKKGLKHRPKRMLDNVDPCTFRSRPIEDGFADWLADSKQVWDQLRFHVATKNQIKKRRKRL